ncbi:MAG: pilus assembly protein PilP [Desulfoplanes sp.]
MDRPMRVSEHGRGILFATILVAALSCFVMSARQSIAGQPDDTGIQPVPDTSNATGVLPAWMQASSYRYDPTNKPDPFIPFIRKEEPQKLRPLETVPPRQLGPLEKIDVTQLQVIGILWYPQGDKEALGMVQLPDGKGFVLEKGMYLGRRNGIVDNITPEAIIVKERGLDIFGKEKTQDVRIRLHSEKREVE